MTVLATLSCDAGRTRAESRIVVAEAPFAVLLTTILTSSLAVVDGSVMNVALPAVGRSLHAEGPGLQWIVNIYLLPFSAWLLVGGALGDAFGARRVLVVGVVVFSVASTLCAVATDLTGMLVGRFLQGAGAAMAVPTSLAILGRSFPNESKGRVVGIWAASGATMGAVGPLVGGAFVDLGAWRGIFLINIPSAIAAVVLAARFVPKDRTRVEIATDYLGCACATIALGATAWALTIASDRGSLFMVALLAVTAIIAFVGFVLVEDRRCMAAMMPLRLFSSRRYIALSLLTFLLYAALGELFLLLPYVLITRMGYSATRAGAALLPLPLMVAVLSPWSGALSGRVGTSLPLMVGCLSVGVGFAVLALAPLGAGYWSATFPAVLIVAVGMSAVVAPLTTAVLTSVDAAHVGAASGLNSALARTGSLVAIALLGAVFSARSSHLLSAYRASMTVGAVGCVVAALCAMSLMGPGDAAASSVRRRFHTRINSKAFL